MDLNEIQWLLRGGQYEITFHAQQERLEEDLDLIQIEAAIIEHGELLEEYPDDPRGESCLVLVLSGVDRSMRSWDGRQ